MARVALFVSVGALALVTAACTVVSGVDDLELRSGTTPAPTATQDGAGNLPDPFAGGGGGVDASTPDTSADISPPTGTGPLTCGSQGSWLQGCVAPPATATCAQICKSQGFACVDSCCATDTIGDYAAKVGMVYVLQSECSLKSITSEATFGLCADPVVLPTGFTSVRCCCK